MNGENYYFQTGLSAVIYKIYRWATGRRMISEHSTSNIIIDPLDYFLAPEYKNITKDNVWNMGSDPAWDKKN